MVFSLTESNLVHYLAERKLIDLTVHALTGIDCCSSKNFNLVAMFSGRRSLLVKQKRLNHEGQFHHDFYDEWRVAHLMQAFPELSSLIPLTSTVLHYDSSNAILVSEFFPNYQDLSEYHDQSHHFPCEIGAAIGQSVAQVHRLTYKNLDYCDFLVENSAEIQTRTPKFLNRFNRIGPDIFGTYCQDGIDFFRLLQRSTALTEAIADLKTQWQPSCLIHRDLKLDNVIVNQNWQRQPHSASVPILKIIDWELFTWGDPLYDLGTLVGSYLMRWLETLVVHQGLSMQQSLRLAEIPLEQIQPILLAMLKAYGQSFPEILHQRPLCWQVTLQYAGFYIFRRMIHHLSRHEPFDQSSLCSLQIVKRLLCEPEFSFGSILGLSLLEFESDFIAA